MTPRVARWLARVTVLLPMLAAWRMARWLNPNGAATTPDSLAYLQSAASLLHGQGLSLPDTTTFGRGLVPMTLWAPLYPAWLSGWLAVQSDAAHAAALAGAVMLMLLALLLAAGARRWLPWPLASAYALGMLSLPSVQLVYTYAWSETLCMPLLLACALVLMHGIGQLRRGASAAALPWLAVAGVLTGAMIWTRYAAVAFVPLAGLLTWSGASVQAPAQRRRSAVAATLPAVLVAAPLLLHNLLTEGHLSGGERGAAADAWIDAVLHLAQSSLAYVFANGPLYPALLLGGGAALAWMCRAAPAAADSTPGLPDDRQLLGWVLGYLLGVVLLGRLQHIDDDARMVALVVPLFALLPLAWAARLARGPNGRLAWLLPLAWWLMAVAQGLPALAEHPAAWLKTGTPRWPAMRPDGPLYGNFTANPQYRVYLQLSDALLRAGARGRVYLDQAPLPFRTLTGREGHLVPEPLDAANLARLNETAGPGAAMIVDQPRNQQRLAALYGERLKDLPRIAVPGLEEAWILRLPLPAPPAGPP